MAPVLGDRRLASLDPFGALLEGSKVMDRITSHRMFTQSSVPIEFYIVCSIHIIWCPIEVIHHFG